jgi:hypothetical protein
MKAQIGLKHNEKVIKEDEIKHLLKPGEVGLTLELTVRDKDGKITEHRGPMRSKSFVRQYMELLYVQMMPVPETTMYQVRDRTNTLQDLHFSRYTLRCDAVIGDVTNGIVAGTGNTAPTINDYVMETPIAHGVGAGQLQYGAVTFGLPAYDAATSQYTITRDLANGSGGAITVNEIGLYVEGYHYNVHYDFLAVRDVIGGGINIPNGQTLTVNYRPQATA